MSYLPQWIKAAGYRVVDIHSWEQVDFNLVTDDGHTDCLFEGIPLQSFVAVVFTGAPYGPANQLLQDCDQGFIRQERNQAVLAAILGSQTKLINSGFWVDFHQILTGPESQLRILSAIGWKTPSVFWNYDFSKTHQEKCRKPEPHERALLVLTRRRRVLMPDAEWTPQLDMLVDKTQNFMSDFRLDWCVIAVGSQDDGNVAYGLRAELPETLPLSVAAELIRDAVRAA
jgi:hypothetical protein